MLEVAPALFQSADDQVWLTIESSNPEAGLCSVAMALLVFAGRGQRLPTVAGYQPPQLHRFWQSHRDSGRSQTGDKLPC